MGKKLKTIDQINQERTRSPREVSRTRSPRELGRTNRAGGGLMEATARLKKQGLKNGGVARGCGAIMSDRRKKTKIV
jgi:flagellar biosynthesis/type III secretory pathway chaperone